jgi:membrane protease YdiL (CAAX protease family)
MPAAAGLILTGKNCGRGGIKALIYRLGIWRVGWKWWAAAVLVQPILLVFAGLVYNAIWLTPRVTMLPLGSFAAFLINIIFLAIATLGEEIGWRGVALPGLQSQRSAFMSSLILGFFWAAWHIPFWLLLDTFDQFGWVYIGLNILFVFPLTFYMTWFYNHTRSSLLLPVAFHLSFNIVNTAIFPVTINPGAFAMYGAINWFVTLFILRHLESPKP